MNKQKVQRTLKEIITLFDERDKLISKLRVVEKKIDLLGLKMKKEVEEETVKGEQK